jgi:nucleotide-binding universal stress UspA family protein
MAELRDERVAYITKPSQRCRREMAAEGFRKIMVAFDGSEDSVKASRLACSLAQKFGSQLIVVHVYSFALVAYGGATPMPMPDVRPLEEASKAKALAILDRGLDIAKEFGVAAQGKLIEAPSIVQALVEYGTKEGVDLMVAGTRGMTGLKKLMMGSVSSGLVGHAKCPVLVVR